MTSAILNSIKTKSSYYKLSKLGIIDETFYKRYKNKLTSVIRISKETYYKKSFEDCRSDVKRTWHLI